MGVQIGLGGIILVSISEITVTEILIILSLIFFLYAFVYPQSQLKKIKMQRLSMIKRMERMWGTKVLTMIHRKEAVSMLGVPVYQYIDVEDAEQVLRAIRETGDRPIDIIMHTPGGQMHASIQIARALNNHKEKVRIMIPHYCMSGGTIIALAADEIVMDPDAIIGPIDPQVGDLIRGTYPAPSWIYAAEKKGMDADDTTIIMSDISKKAMELTKYVIMELLENKIQDEEKRKSVAQKLLSGEMMHVTPISAKEAIELGLPVSTELPSEVHDFMKFFRSAKMSVEYIE